MPDDVVLRKVDVSRPQAPQLWPGEPSAGRVLCSRTSQLPQKPENQGLHLELHSLSCRAQAKDLSLRLHSLAVKSEPEALTPGSTDQACGAQSQGSFGRKLMLLPSFHAPELHLKPSELQVVQLKCKTMMKLACKVIDQVLLEF
ncbi:unnamed protein product [Caenorhabditis auriculariae]|uniref:Uncharacterized protein n=1 Tax=Caenorhabditis auriculariae TaxID=2777116 RepID=A0A8S1HGG6_9PELO|nr:unnamed protein product [Caenorhabditis auriculariae]